MSPHNLGKSRNQLTMEARIKAVAVVMDQCVKWYLQENGGVGPEEIREHTYDGERVFRWLEPALPGRMNPVIVEGYTRGFWGVRIEDRNTFTADSI